jgi:hypothetical protein
MKIFGVSQSTSVERQLRIERGIEGVVLTITDHVGGKERGRIIVPSDSLVDAIMEPVVGGSIIDGIPPPQGGIARLSIEVRRNEVWLAIRPESGDEADVAVGFDDLQDALEGVISRA